MAPEQDGQRRLRPEEPDQVRVGLFTARPLGEAIAQIVASSGVEVVGRVHQAAGWWGVAGTEHADDVFSEQPDLVVSCLTAHIFTPAELAVCRIVNLHPAPLPDYRGCNSYSHAILNGDTTYGVTLHEVDATIDTGSIIMDASFPITADATARAVHDTAQTVALAMFRTWWTNRDTHTSPPTPQQGEGRYYRRDSLERYRRLADHPPSSHDRIRRALTFPPFPMPEECP